MTTMASKDEINVFHAYFKEFNALFDWALQKNYFHTFVKNQFKVPDDKVWKE